MPLSARIQPLAECCTKKYTVPGGGEDSPAEADGFAVFVDTAPVVGVDPPVAPFELDDPPPHAVSSNAADTSPAAAAHPLLRITYSIPIDPYQYAGNVPEGTAARRCL